VADGFAVLGAGRRDAARSRDAARRQGCSPEQLPVLGILGTRVSTITRCWRQTYMGELAPGAGSQNASVGHGHALQEFSSLWKKAFIIFLLKERNPLPPRLPEGPGVIR